MDDHHRPSGRFRRLTAWLAHAGWMVSGSVIRPTQRPNLWLWHFQVWDAERTRWRTVTRVLPPDVVPMVRAAIATDRRFRRAHKALRALSMQMIERERRTHLRRPPRERP